MNPNLVKLLFFGYLSINSVICSPVRMDNPGIYSDDPEGLEDSAKHDNWMGGNGEDDGREVKMVECRGGVCGGATGNVAAPPKREMFVSRGWGAGGMPFNVLYMNSKSSKLGSSGSSQPRTAAILAEPLRSPSSADINDEYPVETSYPGGAAGNSPRYTGRTKNKSQSSSGSASFRKHYSIIPQLFVSYGWGPIGK
ncbi:uncharacterized protein LOC111043258 [Nilaparvata lugens]|uniref:uncharacterized protein LOC111043258 n=1 Tax=Nilaparvata lugens TaxID=108931 RepID=UPI00193CB045|nr:uncharacterized protein LOC111043258 [Nilaparvata lugens]XP_039283827.1 uncharacterized protein LOC111043258 [Nilaparvata lugens]XP_039283828.1 uncharacterized protein LOC111043258 [Nilaparvata lugens]